MTRIVLGPSSSLNGRRRRSFIAALPPSFREMLEQHAKIVAKFHYDNEMLKSTRVAQKEVRRRFQLDNESSVVDEIFEDINELLGAVTKAKTSMEVYLGNIKEVLLLERQIVSSQMDRLMDKGVFTQYTAPDGMFKEDREGFRFMYRDLAVYIEFITPEPND